MIAFIYYILHQEYNFDYTDKDAPLAYFEDGWSFITPQKNQPITLNFDQSYIILYNNDDDKIRYRCKGGSNLQNIENMIALSKDNCIIYIPKLIEKIDINQSHVFFMNITQDIPIMANQSKIELYTKEKPYQYDIINIESHIDDFHSDNQANNKITINAKQSRVKYFETE